MMVQERIEVFKNTFEVLMTKSLVSLGKFNRSIGPISKDDVVLILDKKKDHFASAELRKVHSGSGGKTVVWQVFQHPLHE